LVRKKKKSKGTLARYERLKEKTEEFLKAKHKISDIALEEIQVGLAANLYHYLLINDIGENTAMKYVKTLSKS
jgi:hypothetical protein